jgi:hypothetical protein
MGILDMKNLNILRESDIDYHLLSKSQENVYNDVVNNLNNSHYMSNSDSNSTSILSPEGENLDYYHKNNLGLLMLMMIAFFILSYYLHYVSKYNIKKAKSTNTESNITFMKYSNLQNLSIANFSKKK